MANNGGMIDVSDKDITIRTAKASASVLLGEEAFQTVKQGCPYPLFEISHFCKPKRLR